MHHSLLRPDSVTARCMRVALEERILEMVKTVTKRKASSDTWENWVVPDITWVNGVSGCDKTTWIVKHFELGRDVVITTTREVARDFKGKLACRLGAGASSKVRTVSVNGFRGPRNCVRRI
ncbi:hypothetical protein EVAR_64222_1 [Eumeta japonica]|uniref:(+)RNA virus helicase C-terminal domain-containing protein n=1 Tax=Eumeta variegata TaxID=151549 RepID=A0A4C1ZS82_EUMVA|nr:hypothetical protein EVAR_64222_1 [Eumeta japonica]